MSHDTVAPAAPSVQGVVPALSEDEIIRVRELLEKQAIYENMVKYTRAIDRFDLERIKDAYWPDATDDHGLSVGSGHEFAEVAYARRKDGPLKMCSHLIGNVQIELNGTQAKAESAFLVVAVLTDGDGVDFDHVQVGRYRDLYEKRGDEWKILRRTVIWEWNRDEPTSENWARVLPAECKNFGADYPDDLIYGEW